MKENHSSDSCTKVNMFNSMIAVFTVLVLCVYSISIVCLQHECYVFTV